MYGKCIEHIQAQENLTLISAYQTVYLDEKKQKEKIKALNKLAYPADEAVKNNKSIFDQIKQAINGR